MLSKKENVAIITARGGSKRIPRKNIKDFAGKPLISYAIEAALKSGLFSEVMVSTEDAEIAEISKKSGAKIPFLRSAKNADDFSSTVDTLLEVLSSYAQQGRVFENFCCIYPTAPFLTAQKITDSYGHFSKGDGDFCVAITNFSYPVQRRLELSEQGQIHFTCPEFLSTRSQDLKKSYHDVGQFYWGKTGSLEMYKSLFGGKALGYFIPELETQDIDSPEDWEIAEFKYRYLKNAGRI